MAKNDKVKVVVTGKVNTVTPRDRQNIFGASLSSTNLDDVSTFIAYASVLRDHTANSDIHITAAERDRWNRLSNIFVNGSINLENFVDVNMLATTLSGYIKTTTFNDLKNTVVIPHINNEEMHATAEEKAFWNAKQPAGNYATKAEVDGKITVALSELNVNNLNGMEEFIKTSVADTRYLRKSEADLTYATAEQIGSVETRVETLEGSDFATKQDLLDVSIALSNIPSDVFTETNIGEKTIPQLGSYYTKTEADQKFLTGNDYAAIEATYLPADLAAATYATKQAMAEQGARIDASIAEALANYDSFAISVHEALTDIEHPMSNRIYLIPKENGLAHEGNLYTEYVWHNNAFEKVGADDVNPADFASAADFAAHLQAAAAHINDTVAHITAAERTQWNDVVDNFDAKVADAVNPILQQNNFATLGNVQMLASDLRAEMSLIPKFKFEVVESLEAIETISASTIYLVADQGESEDDMFVEYINPTGVAGAFERLGIQKRIDMTGYYTKAEVDTALAQLEARITTDSSAAADTYALKADVQSFQTEQQSKNTEIDASIDALQNDIAAKATVASVEALAATACTKDEADNKDITAIATAVAQAKDYADGKFLEIDSSINDIKSIIPTLITSDALATALGSYSTSSDIQQAYLSKTAFADDLANYDTSVQAYVADQINSIDYSSFATKNELPNFTLFATKAELPDFTTFALKADMPDFNSFASKNDISTAIDEEDASIQSYVTGHVNQIGQQIEALAQNQTQVVIDDELTENGENAVQGKAIYKVITDNEKVVSAGLNKAFGDIAGLIADIEAVNEALSDSIGDLGGVEVESDSFDYIYDENSWNASYANGALKKYYQEYPMEDLYSTTLNRIAQFDDWRYSVDMIWADETAETLNFDAAWIDADVQKMSDGTNTVYAKIIDFEVGETYQVFRDQAMTEFAGSVTVNSISAPGFTQCWEGAVNAPGAKYPWICPNFDTDVNATIKLVYKGKGTIQPWGDNVFGVARRVDGYDRLYGMISVAEQFQENGFLISENQANANPDWSNDESGFDISKFKMILVKQDETNTVKSYIDQKFAELLFQLS